MAIMTLDIVRRYGTADSVMPVSGHTVHATCWSRHVAKRVTVFTLLELLLESVSCVEPELSELLFCSSQLLLFVSISISLCSSKFIVRGR